MNNKFKLKKGDEVIVLTGKDKGKTGKIVKMMPKQMKAIVSEINRVKKNQNQTIISQVVLSIKKCQCIFQIFHFMILN